MTIRFLRMTVLTVAGFGLLGATLHADDADGVAKVGSAATQQSQGYSTQHQYYVATGRTQKRQAPNPTYWTWMPLPFHGCCDYCAEPGCPGQKGFWTFPVVRWVLDPDYYTMAPDYGWSPPARVPVRRRNVTYQNYIAATAYGKQGSGNGHAMQRRPIIATPTDTTQLGYYYQHVPTWQPKNILPAPPDPRTWHTRPCIPDQNHSYVRWVKIQNAWTPLHNIQGSGVTTPTPVEPALPNQALPAPPVEEAPVPVIPMKPRNAPEALIVPEFAEPIRRVSS